MSNIGHDTFLPKDVILEITYACNLRCNMCYLSDGYLNKLQSQMSFEEIKRLLDNLAEFRPTIVLTGGEPFARNEDLESIVRYSKFLQMKTGIFTNGTNASQEALRDVVDAGVDWLSISLDGPEDVYESVTRVKGSFAQVMNTLDFLSDYCRDKSTSLTLSAVLSEQSIDKIDFVISFLQEKNVKLISLLHYHFLTHNDLLRNHTAFRQLGVCANTPAVNQAKTQFTPEFVNKVLTLEHRFREVEGIAFVPNLSPQEIEIWYGNSNAFPVQEKCFYPWAAARIAPDGTVYACQNHVVPFGNVRTAKFQEIWNGEVAGAFRNALKHHGMFPGCNRCCKVKAYTRSEFPSNIPTVFN